MVELLTGLIGGLVATIIMTVFMMALGDDSPPPTAIFWAKYIGDGDPKEYLPQGMVLHLIYGISAGGAFAVGVPLIDFVDVESLEMAVFWGLAYGVILFVVAAILWMKVVLQIEPEKKMVGLFLLFHLIYGLVLGGWIGLEIF